MNGTFRSFTTNRKHTKRISSVERQVLYNLLHADFKTSELVETKSIMGPEDGEISDKKCKLPVIR